MKPLPNYFAQQTPTAARSKKQLHSLTIDLGSFSFRRHVADRKEENPLRVGNNNRSRMPRGDKFLSATLKGIFRLNLPSGTVRLAFVPSCRHIFNLGSGRQTARSTEIMRLPYRLVVCSSNKVVWDGSETSLQHTSECEET